VGLVDTGGKQLSEMTSEEKMEWLAKSKEINKDRRVKEAMQKEKVALHHSTHIVALTSWQLHHASHIRTPSKARLPSRARRWTCRRGERSMTVPVALL
jgi:hypothetical protein